MSEPSFWSGRKVFITGINGFVGGNLTQYLVGMGADVTGLIRNSNEESYLFFEGVAPRVKLAYGDLIDKELLTRIVVEEQIQCVLLFLQKQIRVWIAPLASISVAAPTLFW